MPTKNTSVKATRGFMYAGKPVAAGTTLSVPQSLAQELVAMSKVEIVAVAPVFAKDESLSTEDAQTVKDEAAATRNQSKGKK